MGVFVGVGWKRQWKLEGNMNGIFGFLGRDWSIPLDGRDKFLFLERVLVFWDSLYVAFNFLSHKILVFIFLALPIFSFFLYYSFLFTTLILSHLSS